LKSEKAVRRLGYAVNPLLPSLEGVFLHKTTIDVVRRILVLNCIVAVAHGFERERARHWISHNELTSSLSEREREFIDDVSKADHREFMAQGESLWALVWAVGKIEKIDFAQRCSAGLVKMLPDLLNDAPGESWAQSLKLRTELDIIAACDLAYRLHWAITDAHLQGVQVQSKVPPYVVIERRRALEWMLQAGNWDDVVLDT